MANIEDLIGGIADEWHRALIIGAFIGVPPEHIAGIAARITPEMTAQQRLGIIRDFAAPIGGAGGPVAEAK